MKSNFFCKKMGIYPCTPQFIMPYLNKCKPKKCRNTTTFFLFFLGGMIICRSPLFYIKSLISQWCLTEVSEKLWGSTCAHPNLLQWTMKNWVHFWCLRCWLRISHTIAVNAVRHTTYRSRSNGCISRDRIASTIIASSYKQRKVANQFWKTKI